MNNSVFPVIALIGQKNVGKSTLFNRLTRTNFALISNSNLGLTRDRQYGNIRYKRCTCVVIDTGGFDRLSNTCIQSYVNAQTILAIKESYIILFVVDGRSQISSVDYDIISYLRKLKKNVFVIINKIDNDVMCSSDNIVYDYYSLGIKDVICVSAIHNYGISNLLDRIILGVSKDFYNYNKDRIFESDKYPLCYKERKSKLLGCCKSDQFIKLAVVGRPNSGKSTFINYILKTNRMITSELPGTTRDSIYIPTIYGNQKYILIDTAGVRKKKQIRNMVEHISVVKTLQVIQCAHIILFMIDINEGVVDQDLSLLRLILNRSQALIIVINKWDTSESSTIHNNFNQSLVKNTNFFNNAKIHFISSLYGKGIKILFQSINKIHQRSMQTLNTAHLTRIMYQAIIKYPPPFLLGTRTAPKPKYVHIGGLYPPIIVVHGTQVSKLSNEYRRYLRQYFYRSLNIKGILIRMRFKDTVNPFK